MLQPQTISVIPNASLSQASSWILTSSGVAVNTQTITIAGIVFTSVDSIGSTAGNVLVDASAEAFIENLVAAINDPLTTNTKHVALSADNAAKLQTLGITAVKTSATVMTLTSSVVKPGTSNAIVVSETETNFVWTTSTTSAGFAPQGLGSSAQASIQLVASGVTSGNGVFTVEVSNDGTNWTAYNRITTNVTNTNAQTDTRVASVTLSSNTSSIVTIPDPYAYYRVKCVVSVDGAYSATAYVL
jgi:hypothetical protein